MGQFKYKHHCWDLFSSQIITIEPDTCLLITQFYGLNKYWHRIGVSYTQDIRGLGLRILSKNRFKNKIGLVRCRFRIYKV